MPIRPEAILFHLETSARQRRYRYLEVIMEREVISTTEARQGKPVGAMRWVLGFGLAGAIVGLIIVGLLTGFFA